MALVLVVDDSSYQRMLIKKYLIAQGHDVLEAANGDESLEIIDNHEPDFILLDLIMPKKSGLDVLKALQTRHSTIPVVVNTADIQASTYEQCMSLGAFAVLNKPLNSTKLYETIRAALNPEEDDSE